MLSRRWGPQAHTQQCMLLLLALAAVNCTRTVETRSESAVQATAAVQETASSALDEVVQTGPSTTTVYKFALPDNGGDDAKGVPSVPLGTTEGSNDGEELLQGGLYDSAVGAHPFGQWLPPPRQHETPRSNLDQHADNLPPHGPLVEMDVIQTGPILDTKRQTSAEASSATQTVKAEKKATTKTKTAPALSAYVWMALAALVVGAIGWAAWKLSPLGKIL